MSNKAPMISERTVRRLAAEARAAAVAAEAALAGAVLRDANGKPLGLKPEALPFITQLASGGAAQDFVASRLGLSGKQFKTLMGTGDAPTDVRLAFEKGRVEHEADISRRLLKHGEKWAPSIMFYAKSRLRWRENESVVDARNEDNRRIQITVNEPMAIGQLLRGLDQKEIIDGRRDKSIPLDAITPAWMKAGLAEVSAQDDIIEGEFVDTPAPQVPAAPPAPPAALLSFEELEELQRARTAAAFAKSHGGVVPTGEIQ